MNLVQFLSRELSTTPSEIARFQSLAPNKYKVYAIPKRTSGKRIIAHPSKRLKAYQRATTKYLQNYLNVHSSAYAYQKGTGIKANANCHKGNRYLLKMDFKDFFHSINDSLFFEICKQRKVNFPPEDMETLRLLLFWRPSKKINGKLVLSIGAPSSPFISNSMMYDFDSELHTHCRKNGVTYTRYADDLTFSSNIKGATFDVPDLVKSLLSSELQGSLTINDTKTVFSSKAHNRHVTGVTINNNGDLSLGRKRKRYISSLIHRYSLGVLIDEDLSHLKGLISFSNDIEPEFISRMETKYGKIVLEKLRGPKS